MGKERQKRLDAILKAGDREALLQFNREHDIQFQAQRRAEAKNHPELFGKIKGGK